MIWTDWAGQPAEVDDVRLDALFEDLESQFDALRDGELYSEVADRIRAELGRITVLDRLRGAVGTTVRIEFGSGQRVGGRVSRVGKDCVLIEAGRSDEWLFPVAALTAVHDLGPWAEPAEGTVAARLGLAHMLRGIARDRSPVTVLCHGIELAAVTGTIDRVGADFIELAEHPLDVPRRRGEISHVRLIPTSAIVAVRRR